MIALDCGLHIGRWEFRFVTLGNPPWKLHTFVSSEGHELWAFGPFEAWRYRR